MTVSNRSGVPIRFIAVDGFSTGQVDRSSFSAGPADELLGVEVPDGERVAVDARWFGRSVGDGEGLGGGAVVATSLGVPTATCGDRLQCWFVEECGLPSEPDLRLIFSTTVSLAEVGPWT